jgi:hypothetical protein
MGYERRALTKGRPFKSQYGFESWFRRACGTSPPIASTSRNKSRHGTQSTPWNIWKGALANE